jgi:protein-arginine deiminase
MRANCLRPLASIIACCLAPVACGGNGDAESQQPGKGGQGGIAGAAGDAGTGGGTAAGSAGVAGSAAGDLGGSAGAGAAAGTGGDAGTGGASDCPPGATETCYSGPANTLGVGICVAGTRTCAADGSAYGPCEGEITPSIETCATDADDDCDGEVNEDGTDCTCAPGSTSTCYSGPAGTAGVGICASGTQTCNPLGTGYGPCHGEVLPATEDCSTSEDENCDGQTPPCSGIVVDLRADVNRNGTIDLADPTEDANEQTWDDSHGAIFLANIDDDDASCSKNGADAQLAACHDASNAVIDGPDDLLDLARLQTVPWPAAPDAAKATLEISSPAASYVRLFKRAGSTFQLFEPTTATLSAAELREGVELAIEGKDVVRDAAVWDGYVDITLRVDDGTGSGGTDKIRMRQAPMLLRHHLHDADTVYATSINHSDSVAFRTDLSAAMAASGMTKPLATLQVDDQWTQDFFETAYMSMPAPGGAQKIIHVNIRSANYTQGGLRSGGRVVYTVLRGKDTAGVTQYDAAHSNNMDSLNSFGNTETIPPYAHGGQVYPEGRILRGATSTYYPDKSMDRMFDAQGAQPTVFLPTDWLLVGHVDETVSFFKASTTRGWGMMINDAPLAKQLLQQQKTAGNGAVMMFAGMYDYSNNPARVSITDTLDDTDLMNTNAWAAVEVSAQLTQLKQVTGITDSEVVKIPFLWDEAYGYAVAYVPGMINGIMLAGNHFGSPDPHGPVIQGKDVFKSYVEDALADRNVTVHWVEDWYLYHILDGEVHCGSNTKRVVPATHRWWEGDL